MFGDDWIGPHGCAGECPTCFYQTLDFYWREDDDRVMIAVRFRCTRCGYMWQEHR